MLTVFGLSMSVSLSETAKAADETSTVAQVGTTTYGTLNGAIGAAAEGDTVTLLKDTTENVVVDKDITLDLNGFTLNGGTGTAKAAITNKGTLTIKDSSAEKTGTIKRDDSGIVGETSYYVIRNLGTMTIEQANVVNNSGYRETNPSGSMIGSSLICNGDNDEGASLTINGGKLTQLNFIAIKNGANGTLFVNGGEITSNHSAIQNWYNATITGGKITGQIWTDAYIAGESVGNTVIDGDVKFTGEIVMDVYGSIEPKLTINGGNLSVTNWRITTACAKLGGKPAVQGGTFTKAVPAEYCAEGFVPTEIEAGKYGVKAEPLTFDEDGICRISTEAELKRFAEMANAGDNFAGKTVYLENDIDLNNKLWTPIGVYGNDKTYFKGTFDGRNHTITGLKVNESRKNGVGFFGKVSTGTIKNLTVEGTVSVSCCNYVGGIVGHGYATITNCTFKGTVGSKDTMQVGGIAGSGGFTITNCSVYGNVIAECWAGGIVGNCQDGGAYTNCYVDGTISSERTYWGGGAAGITPVPLYPSQVISQCYSDTVVKVAGEEVNCPIIASYNNPLDYNGYTGDLKIYDNSWNKAKNSNDSYPIYAEKNGEGGVLEEGKDVSRDNTLIMLEGDLNYIDRKLPRSKIKILPGSAVTAKTIDDMTVAAIGEEKYFSLEAAIAAAKDGETVKLLADVEQNSEVSINKNITLDLNGKKIYNTKDIWHDTAPVIVSLIAIRDGAEVTVMGDGTIAAKANDCYTINIVDGDLTIENGTFIGNISVVQVQKGRLTINGGTFSLIQKMTDGNADRYLINCIDQAFTANDAQVAIYGGSFAGFDPNVSPEAKVDGKVPSYAAPGVGITKNENGSFTAKANMAAQILDSDGNSVKAYATLAEAIAAAKDGDTITLLANVAEFEGAEVTKNLTFDFGDYTITGKTGATVLKVENATVTLNGNNGGIDGGAGGDNIAVRANTGAEVIINGGVYTVGADANGLGNSTVYVTDNGKVTINGGTFSSKAAYNGKYYVLNVNNSAKGTFVVKGGTFKDFDPLSGDDNLGGNFAPEGYGANRDENGNFTIVADVVAQVKNASGKSVKAYATLQEAVNAAVARKAIVMLLADTRENVTIAQMLTLDLNGYTINGGKEKGKPAVTVTQRIVTIKDSSEAQTGTIMREDTAENSGVSSHYVIDVQGNGLLTFESGNVINHSGVVGVKGASLVRVGDDSVGKQPSLVINGGTFTQDNFIVIKVDRGYLKLNGGTLNSANSYAIENWFRATVKGGTVNGTVSSWTYSGGFNSTLEILGGTINGDVTSVNYGNATDKKAKVSVTGGIINGELDTRAYDPKTNKLTSIIDAAKATIEVSGGTFTNAVPTEYCAEGFIPTKNANGTFGVEKTEKVYLAKIGETFYSTMEEAFEAQKTGEAIVLLRDYTTASKFNSGSINRVVDLNGHTWTYTGTRMNEAAFEINHSGVTLTVKNGTIISNTLVGLISSASERDGTIIAYDNAGLVFEGVTMTSNGGSGIETNGNNTNDSVTLINSTLNVPNGFGIYFPSSGTLTINNSTINAKTMGVQVCSGELNINAGSAITVTGDAVTKTENDGAIQDGAAISIVNRPGYKGLSNIVITGGTFTAKAGNDAIKAYDWANKVESEFTKADLVAVSGGTFSSEVKKDYLADRFVVNKNTNGTYGVTAGSGFVGACVVVTESLAMKVVVSTASKYVVVTYKGLDGIAKTVRLDKFTDIKIEGKDYKYCLFDQIMPQMIDVKFSFELYGENDVMLDRKANYSVVDYLADIIASDKDSTEFRNVAASLIEYANRAKVVKGLATTVAPTFVDKDGKTVTLDYNAFVDAHKIPAKDTLGAISEGDGQVIYQAKVVFDDAYTLTFYTNDNEKQYTYKLDDKDIVFDENGKYTVNVLAQNITTKYVLTVYDKDSKLVQTVTYGVSTYCIRMQETETPQGELYVASYYYGVAVNQYGTANPNSVQG